MPAFMLSVSKLVSSSSRSTPPSTSVCACSRQIAASRHELAQEVAPKVGLSQAEPLEHGAHGAVQKDEPLRQECLQRIRARGGVPLHTRCPPKRPGALAAPISLIGWYPGLPDKANSFI